MGIFVTVCGAWEFPLQGDVIKKLVYVAHTFPPVSTGSAPLNIRITGLLAENGWESIVVTPGHGGGLPRDPSLTDLLHPSVEVVRTGSTGRRAAPRKIPVTETGFSRASSIRQRLRKFVLESLLQPDRFVTWLPSALSSTIRQTIDHSAGLIVTLGPPHSTHLTGLLASLITGRKWVPFFGDLWVRDGLTDWDSLPCSRLFWSSVLEETVVGSADGLVTTTPGSSEYFRNAYGSECPPVTTLWTGIPPSGQEIPRKGVPEFDNELLITYTGFFMGNQSPEYFLEGMRLFLDVHPDMKVRLRIVGDLGRYSQMPEELGLSDFVDLIGPVPYGEVSRWQSDSHLLLLLLPPQAGNELKNPSKTVEYLVAGRPILAVAPQGDMTRLIERAGAGYVSDHSPDGICRAMERAVDDLKRGIYRILPDTSALPSELDMEKGVARLASFFDSVVSEGV